MKSIVIALTLLFSNISSALADTANGCTVIVPATPGGTLDIVMRGVQRYNKNIQLDYQPGQFAAPAISRLKQNSDLAVFTPPVMFGRNAPKDPGVELLSVLSIVNVGIFSARHASIEEALKSPKLTLGVPVFGGQTHATALAIKELASDNTEIVAFGGDAKAIPSILNGDIDFYVTGGNAAEQLNALNIKTVNLGPEAKIGKRTVKTYTWFGIWVSKDASPAQRTAINNCLKAAITPQAVVELSNAHTKIVNVTDSKKDQLLKEFLTSVEKYGL
jgi:tripartite-type tricarboxylate transporter receptor subunit TctC